MAIGRVTGSKGEQVDILSVGSKFKAKVTVDAKGYHAFKKEVSRKVSMANKRLERLERNNLTNLSAYKQWQSYNGGVRFSVAGKDYNELQKEMARLNRFLDNKTSLVRQANQQLKDIASNLGLKYKSVKELPAKTEKFFSLAGKVEEYLRNVEGSASAIGYQKIWEVISNYVETNEIELDSTNYDMENVLDDIIQLSKYDVVTDNIEFDTFGYINR